MGIPLSLRLNIYACPLDGRFRVFVAKQNPSTSTTLYVEDPSLLSTLLTICHALPGADEVAIQSPTLMLVRPILTVPLVLGDPGMRV
jgi:hypothetical protein